jgi:hypothetical protein
MDEITLQQRVLELTGRYQGLRAAARALDIDPGYLHRLKAGEKINPGQEILDKLGLKIRQVIYCRKRKRITKKGSK